VAYTSRADLSTRTIEGEVVILDKRSGRIHQLNSTASFVWNRMRLGMSLAAIASEMVREFDVEIEVAQADVDHVLAEFVRLELISTSDSDLDPSNDRGA
jgi:hypothetical protein